MCRAIHHAIILPDITVYPAARVLRLRNSEAAKGRICGDLSPQIGRQAWAIGGNAADSPPTKIISLLLFEIIHERIISDFLSVWMSKYFLRDPSSFRKILNSLFRLSAIPFLVLRVLSVAKH
ncbi:MAG: hypothetical protein IJ268_09795 [Proteobacteria bacterium]|nr:hypothetical protein [Pseudomonadota bacterium]